MKVLQKLLQGATLPDELEQRTISQMLPGEVGWTVPWAMWADAHRVLWLNGYYSVFFVPRGTVEMRIKRVNDGFEVDVSKCLDEKWLPGPHGFVGGPRPERVIKLTGLPGHG